MRFTAMSCSRQASTVSSGSPFFRASFALCSMWVTVCGMKRNLKKSTIVGLGGIAASAARSSGKPLGVRPPNRTPVPRRSLGAGAAGWWSRSIMASSRASARSSEDSAPAFEPGPATKVLRSASISLSSQTLATLSRAGAGVNNTGASNGWPIRTGARILMRVLARTALPSAPKDFAWRIEGRIALDAGELLRIRDGRGWTIAVVEGEVWITQDGDYRDIVIGAGDRFRLESAGLSLVYVLRHAGITLFVPLS